MSTNKDSQKVPNLRFKGFTDDWEQRKLGELSNIVGGGTPSTSNPEYWDGDIDWYAPAEIGEQSYVNKSKKTITKLGLNKSSARILPVGTVLFTSRAGIGNTAILAKEATTNQGFQSIVPDQNKLDSYFIFSRTNELKRYGEITGAGSTFVEVSGKQMSKMPIMVPVLSEQQKVGTFLKQIDNTITLHQRKLDQLKQLKEALLQQMFPGKGETMPKLRFAGFEGDWEERKLGELGEVSMNKRIYKDQTTLEGEIPFVQIGTFGKTPDAFISRELFDEYKLKYPYPNIVDILLSASGSIGRTLEYKGEDVYFQDSKIVWLNHKGRLDNNFLKYFYTIVTWSGLEGSTIKRLYNKNILSTQINLPNLIEQEKIGNFLNCIENTIILQQRKLYQLKNMKQVLLENMFI